MFKCDKCGYRSHKWLGKCPECNSWDSFVQVKEDNSIKKTTGKKIKPINIHDIEMSEKKRIPTGVEEFDRVMGGGIVTGSLILISGEPGIGKSTLLLKISDILAEKYRVLYISGEESLSQIQIRAKRIKAENNFQILTTTMIENMLYFLKNENPDFVVIDSVQTITSDKDRAPGSVATVRESTARIMEEAKKHDITVFLVGHITKSGNIAGPKTLEHMVDTVLFMEGDTTRSFRILRTTKNRFGSTDEVGIFDMDEEGLKEVKNPSEYLIAGKKDSSSGSIIIPTIEGTRALLIELQALVTPTRFSYPQRVSQGINERKIDLLIAVMQKRMNLDMNNFDIFCNIAGGIKIFEPSIDLGLILSIISSLLDKPIPNDLCAVGEVGLSGEVRKVPYIHSRIEESEKIGFNKILIPHGEKIKNKNIEIVEINNIIEAKRNLNL